MREINVVLIIILSVFNNCVIADDVKPKSYSFGFVPQQSPSKLAKNWSPILKRIEKITGVKLLFKTAPDIPRFEKRLKKGEYDFAYMNPYHYTVYHEDPGYEAFAKQKNKKIKGIVVVRKDNDIKNVNMLSNRILAFPAPAAFAATVLPKASFKRVGVPISSQYVKSHDSVYRVVASGLYPAGGGIQRTFDSVDPEVRNKLRILWETDKYTPHAFAVHPRVSFETVKKVTAAMLSISSTSESKSLLSPIKFDGFAKAENSHWDDVRSLKINLLD